MLAKNGNILASAERRSPKSCLCWEVLKLAEQARRVEGAMDCIENVEVIGRTRLGIMVSYIWKARERGSLYRSF